MTKNFIRLVAGLVAITVVAAETPTKQLDCCSINLVKAWFCNLKAQEARIRNLQVENGCFNNLRTNTFCSQELCVNELSALSTNFDSVCTNSLCANAISSVNTCSDKVSANTVCSQSIATQDLCVTNSFRVCSPFSARAATSADTPYTLGDPVPFDLVLSDPSGSFLQSPTRFISPESGYYNVTVQINQHDLTGPTQILGTPVALLEMYVNGVLRRQVTLPYLSFNNRQVSHMTTQVTLRKGDELVTRYKLLVIDPTTGAIEYPGQVIIVGTPVVSLRTFIFISYLSSICDELECGVDCEIPCVECQPCNVQLCESCAPCVIPPIVNVCCPECEC